MPAALARRDLRRAAARLCTMPRDAALSIAWLAERRSSVPASPPSSDTAVRAFLAAVFSSVRTALFRSRRRSFWRFRLICDLILATGFLRSGTGIGTMQPDAYRLSGASYQAADRPSLVGHSLDSVNALTLNERWTLEDVHADGGTALMGLSQGRLSDGARVIMARGGVKTDAEVRSATIKLVPRSRSS